MNRTLFCVVLVAGYGCARAMTPPGGERDVVPPAVVAIVPAERATVPATTDPLVIRFDERISEQNIEDAVMVSPVTGAVDVEKGRHELEVRLAGGWQADRVYRVTVRPVVRDLFGNVITAPIHAVFSTGAPFPEGAIAGVVYDRISGEPVADARVEARPTAGGAYHLTFTRDDGLYGLPLLPADDYLLRAYVDQNRNHVMDAFERGDSAVVSVGVADTLLRALALIETDSTPANVTRAFALDSQAVAIEFDDYMDASQPQDVARIQLWQLPDSTPVALAGVMYPHAYEAMQTVRADSAAAALPAIPDTAAPRRVAPDTLAPPPARRPPEAPARALPTPAGRLASDSMPTDPLLQLAREAQLLPSPDQPTPTRQLVVRTAVPLSVGTHYRITAAGVTNITGIPGGGGTADFVAAVADSAAAVPPAADTTAVVPAAVDSAAVDPAAVVPPALAPRPVTPRGVDP